MAVFYVWRIVEALYFQAPVEDGDKAHTLITEAPTQMLLVTGLVAVLNIYFGLFPQVPLELANSAAALLVEGVK
jgi:multicomponent Na+:H+ antiporter subunit D